MALSEAKRESTWLQQQSYSMDNLKSGERSFLIAQSKSPYHETDEKVLRRDPSKKSNGSSSHARTRPTDMGKSVAFGTAERRRIHAPATELMQDLGTYTYIPDLRQLNAISSTQQKDQRAQRMTEMKRLRSQKSLKKDGEASPTRKDHAKMVTNFGQMHLSRSIDVDSYVSGEIQQSHKLSRIDSTDINHKKLHQSPSRPHRISQQRTDAYSSRKEMTTENSRASIAQQVKTVNKLTDLISEPLDSQRHTQDHLDQTKEQQERLMNRNMSQQQFGGHMLLNSFSNKNMVDSKLASVRDLNASKKSRKKSKASMSKNLNEELLGMQSRKLAPSESAISLLQQRDKLNQQEARQGPVDGEDLLKQGQTIDAQSRSRLLLQKQKREQHTLVAQSRRSLQMLTAAQTISTDHSQPLINEPNISSEKIPRKLLQQQFEEENKSLAKKISRKRLSSLNKYQSSRQTLPLREVVHRRSDFSSLEATLDQAKAKSTVKQRLDQSAKVTNQHDLKSAKTVQQKHLAILRNHKKSIDGLLQKSALGPLEGRGGYVDQTLQQKKFMLSVDPAKYETHVKKEIIPNRLPQHVAPASLVAFGRFSMSPSVEQKQSANTIDYGSGPANSLVIQEALLSMKEGHLHKQHHDMVRQSLSPIRKLNPQSVSLYPRSPSREGEGTKALELLEHETSVATPVETKLEQSAASLNPIEMLEMTSPGTGLMQLESHYHKQLAQGGHFELQAQVLLPSISNPPLVQSSAKSDEPEISESSVLRVKVKPAHKRSKPEYTDQRKKRQSPTKPKLPSKHALNKRSRTNSIYQKSAHKSKEHNDGTISNQSRSASLRNQDIDEVLANDPYNQEAERAAEKSLLVIKSSQYSSSEAAIRMGMRAESRGSNDEAEHAKQHTKYKQQWRGMRASGGKLRFGKSTNIRQGSQHEYSSHEDGERSSEQNQLLDLQGITIKEIQKQPRPVLAKPTASKGKSQKSARESSNKSPAYNDSPSPAKHALSSILMSQNSSELSGDEGMFNANNERLGTLHVPNDTRYASSSSVAAFSKGRMRSKQGSDFIDIREGGSVRFGSNDSSVAVRITQENGKPGHGSPTERTHSRRSKRSNETLSPRSLARRMSEYDVKEDSADDRRLKALINDAKKTREQRDAQARRTMAPGGKIGNEKRFATRDSALSEQEGLPGPGSYQQKHLNDINYQSSYGAAKQRPAFPLIERSKPTVMNASVTVKTSAGNGLQSKKELVVAYNEKSPQRVNDDALSSSKTKPWWKNNEAAEGQHLRQSQQDAIFASKVPRMGNNQSIDKGQDKIEFSAQKLGTIEQAQQDLTLKTVQKMFAGRQEAHDTKAANLVRVNRMYQLNKADPLVRESPQGPRNQSHGGNSLGNSHLRTQGLVAVPKESQKTSEGRIENHASTYNNSRFSGGSQSLDRQDQAYGAQHGKQVNDSRLSQGSGRGTQMILVQEKYESGGKNTLESTASNRQHNETLLHSVAHESGQGQEQEQTAGSHRLETSLSHKMLIVNEQEANIFSQGILEGVSQSEASTKLGKSTEFPKKNGDQNISKEFEAEQPLTTSMAKEELDHQLNQLSKEVRQAREYETLLAQDGPRPPPDEIYIQEQSLSALDQRLDQIRRENNRPYENQQKFQEEQYMNTPLKVKILEARGGLYNNPPKPRPAAERPVENLWEKKSYNSKYSDMAKPKISRGISNIKK